MTANANSQTSSRPSDLLARYLQAIGEHLPASTRDDVLAELRANLQAQLDDREEELDRPLTDADIGPILQQHGRPIVVAARYLPQQYLIGPAIFPYYLMVLRRATPFVLLISLLAQSANFFTARTLPEFMRTLGLGIGQLFPTFIIFLFWVTVAFVIAEYVYSQNNSKPLGLAWDPTQLPAIKPHYKGKSRVSRIADLVFHCFLLVYVLEIPSHPFLVWGPGGMYLHALSAVPAPVWHTFYIAILVCAVFQLIAKLLALNPGYDHWRIPLDLLTKLASLGATTILVFNKTYFIATIAAAPQIALAQVNYWMNISARIVFAITLITLLIETWRYFRPSLRTSLLAF